jgi:hypothetical protein
MRLSSSDAPEDVPAAHPLVRGSVPRCSARHWGDSGGTPEEKDEEIRVRTGKSRWTGRAWAQCENWRVMQGLR